MFVGGIIYNPILVMDSGWRLLGYFENKNAQSTIHHIFALKKGQPVFPTNFHSDIPAHVKYWDKAIEKRYISTGDLITCKIFLIAAHETIYGYLIVLENIRKLRKIDYLAIEHTSTIIALERMKAKAIEESKHQVRADFFDDLLCGKIESINAIKSLSNIHGLDISKRYACYVIHIEYSEQVKRDGVEREMMKHDVRLMADQLADRYQRMVIPIFRGNQVILLLQVDTGDYKFYSLRDFCVHFANDLYQEIMKKRQYDQIRIGIGRAYPHILDLSKSFHEAIEALAIGKKLEKVPVSHYEDIMIYHLLETSIHKEAKDRYIKNTIQKLVDYDVTHNTNLLTTLEIYYACNCNVTDTAKKQYMHRSTIQYRLDKIREILEIDIDHPERMLELNLGIKLLHLTTQAKIKNKI